MKKKQRHFIIFYSYSAIVRGQEKLVGNGSFGYEGPDFPSIKFLVDDVVKGAVERRPEYHQDDILVSILSILEVSKVDFVNAYKKD